jgi:hypothetical protein
VDDAAQMRVKIAHDQMICARVHGVAHQAPDRFLNEIAKGAFSC